MPWETFLPGITLRWLIGFKGANSALPLLALYMINENRERSYLRDHGAPATSGVEIEARFRTFVDVMASGT